MRARVVLFLIVGGLMTLVACALGVWVATQPLAVRPTANPLSTPTNDPPPNPVNEPVTGDTRVKSVAVSPVISRDIFFYIERGEVEQVKELLAARPELLQARGRMKLTPLHAAVLVGHADLVRQLLDLGAEVNAEAYNRFTPLHFAEDPDIIRLLVAHKADTEAVSAGGTPLQHAAWRLLDDDTSDYAKRGRAMADALVAGGARYDLLSAARLGDVKRVREILKADPAEGRNRGALRDAARNGHLAIVQLLLDHGGDPEDADFGGMTVLYFALKHPPVVKALLKAGADVKKPLRDTRGVATGPLPNGNTILHEAAMVGVVETVELLLAAGAAVDARSPTGRTPLMFAAGIGWPAVVEALHRHKASVDGEDGAKALRAAVAGIRSARQEVEEVKRYRAVVAYLLRAGVPGDLRAAVALGDLRQVKELARGAPAAVAGEEPVLHLAVALDRKDIVTALLDAGHPVEGTEEGGGTALHAAAFWGRADIATLLIDRGAKVEARGRVGGTPLHEAARCGQLAVARVLLAAGGDVNAKDAAGRPPLSWAESSDRAMIDLLQKRGGK